MSFTRDYDVNDPIDHVRNRTWPGEIRNIKRDVQDRMIDSFKGFDSGDTRTEVKRLIFGAQASDPANIAAKIIAYGKAVAGKTELFLIDESGNIFQITNVGKLNLDVARLSNDTYLKARNAANNGDVSIIKVNSSDRIEFASLPQIGSDPAVANDLVRKSYVDALVAAIVLPTTKTFVSRSFNTTYQAPSDGIVVGSLFYVSGTGDIYSGKCYTDANSNPTTQVANGFCGNYGGVDHAGAGFCFPVRSGEYWKTSFGWQYGPTVNISTTLYFVPVAP